MIRGWAKHLLGLWVAGKRSVIGLMAMLLLLLVVTWWADNTFHKHFRADLNSTLNALLDINHTAMDLWSHEHWRRARYVGNSHTLRRIAKSLLATREDEVSLLAMQPKLREQLSWLYDIGGYQEFKILALDNTVLAASYDRDVGRVLNVGDGSDFMKQLQAGREAISHPVIKEVSGEDAHARMYVGAPLVDQQGRVFAIVLLVLDPVAEFYPLLLGARVSSTGESYVFDRQGVMLSDSRFRADLERLGLIKEGETPIGRLRLLDPGTKPKNISPTSDYLPLTKMAREAISRGRGASMDAYLDYRGVKVVGVWMWDYELELGLTVEQDFAEAYRPLFLFRSILYGFSLFSMLALCVFVLHSVRSRMNLQRSEARLKGLVDSLADALVVIDETGVIESVNPTVEKMFGYSEQSLRGRNIEMLMASPYREQHRGYIRRYLNGGEPRAIGSISRANARRKDGTEFPIELSVSEMYLGRERYFTGVIRDISRRVETEESLAEERQFNQMTLDALSSELAVLDEFGGILYVNRAWHHFAAHYPLEICGYQVGDNYLQACRLLDKSDITGIDHLVVQLETMMGGLLDDFTFTYENEGDGVRRWYLVRVTRFIQGERQRMVVSHQNISDRVLIEQKLQRANEDLELMALVAQETDNAVIVTNPEGDVLWVNKGFVALSEYDGDAVVNLSLLALLEGPETDREELQRIAEALVKGQKVVAELAVHSRLGRPYWINIEISPVFDAEGDLKEFIVLERDITELRTIMTELKEAKEAAEEASRSKSAFLATMSHEIRTPMNGVVGMVDVLVRTSLDVRQLSLVETIRESAFALMTLLDDILDFSKIEAGRMELDEVPMMMCSVLESVGATLLPLAENKRIELLLFCDPKIPTLNADPVRLRQILFNLGGNALKFAAMDDRVGKVMLRVDLLELRPDAQRCRIRLQVRDNGIGMSAGVRKRLFRAFVQAESSTTRRFGGTGLGLVICRRLVDMMAGRIEVESEPNVGSVFTIYLDLECAEEALEQFMPDLEGATAIICSSDDTVSGIVSTYLAHAGSDASVIELSVDACRLHLRRGVDAERDLVVVLDGRDLVDEAPAVLVRLQAASSVPVHLLVLSEAVPLPLAEDGVPIRYVRLNALSRVNLVREVAAVLGRLDPALSMAPLEPQVPAMLAPVSLEAAQAQGRLILLAEDNRTNVMVILQQLALLGCVAQVAQNGREALQAWRAGDFDLVLTDCHMPEMDGYDFARAIRREEDPKRRIPIIAITADALKEAHAKCLEAGMDDYLTKPTQVDSLYRKLSRWLPGMETDALQSAPVEPAGEVLEGELGGDDNLPVDVRMLIQAVGTDDRALLVELYREFLMTLDETMLDIEQAYVASDWKGVGDFAHRLKSSANTSGATVLAECCLQLERAGRAQEAQELAVEMVRLPDLVSAVRQWVLAFIEDE